MSRELLDSWSQFQAGMDQLLALAQNQIQIYDPDLSRLKLGSPPRLDQLARLLQGRKPDTLRIALQDSGPLQRDWPRLLGLLAHYAGSMSVLKTADHLAHLRDALVLVDNRHGLILFDRSQSRSKLLIDEEEELLSYLKRFEDIWTEGGTPVSSTTLGL